MTKRLFALALMLCCLTAAALAEGDIWSLYAQSGAGDYLLGTAIPCGEGMLLSVDGVVWDGMALHAEHRGTTASISHAAGLESGALVLYADDVTGSLPPVSAGYGDTVYVASATAEGVISTEGTIATEVTWRGQACPLLQCAAQLTIGAPVTDAQGALIGLIAAVWGEGQNNYVVLPAEPVLAQIEAGIDENSAVIYDGVSDALNGLTETTQTSADPRWISDFTVDVQGMNITVDWSGTTHVAAEGEAYYVMFMDMANPFYSYMTPEDGAMSLSFYAAPERTYAIWVQCCTEDDFSSDIDVNAMQVASTAAAVSFADYAYLDRELYMGVVPADSAENAVKAEKLDTITVEAITDPATDFCLQAVSQYAVDEEITLTMQTVVTTPEGYSFIMDSAYIFMPDIQDNDVWNASLEDVFAGYERFAGFISKGDYTIAYYFDGQLVGSLTFTVE